MCSFFSNLLTVSALALRAFLSNLESAIPTLSISSINIIVSALSSHAGKGPGCWPCAA